MWCCDARGECKARAAAAAEGPEAPEPRARRHVARQLPERAVGHTFEGHERVPRRWRKPVPRAREVEAEASDSRSTGD
jgi:hypothetical protein